ncbi:unnamed protein product [Auanema sp. JU1783]|nr:unnamed protein product [Auanema sp. JU1783]
MRHKKIPTANRKKLKQVDPFNKKGAAIRKEALKKFNHEPKSDEQPLTRAELELEEARKSVFDKTTKSKKKESNRMLEEAKKAGLVKGRFEGMQQFMIRVLRTLSSDIQEHGVKVKQGTAAKSQKELEADMKILEDKEKKQKEQKKREVQNKIEAARKERKRKEEIALEKEELKRQRQEERRLEREAAELQDQEHEAEKPKNDEEGVIPESMRRDQKPLTKSNKPAKRAEKRKEEKAIDKKAKHLEGLINSKEVIKFGERCDAPPKFEGVFKKTFDPLMAKAGGKNLLLHSIMKKETGIKTQYLEDNKTKPNEIDRQKVIEAYRDMKRKRNAIARQ